MLKNHGTVKIVVFFSSFPGPNVCMTEECIRTGKFQRSCNKINNAIPKLRTTILDPIIQVTFPSIFKLFNFQNFTKHQSYKSQKVFFTKLSK